ncbi:hypothetical protein G6F46_008660 [Rhizopus delemar]|uniref:VPS4-associated protein 1 n=3 Tax=Rhizopus TaxID=4842 RepID=I1BYP7_RHIO9|nr:hypothetical protein RO3G_06032 [Rhizopus delemar RA 99-880]KAG1453962.1 hypothetical protein G6F55_007860 [Rhizopus delemar]KAG1541306.1 hypothetical protein G6F51_007980 [Rhizopus arrhizus]KAG1493472.1 hypothetical protein G6F54_008551 [Rhizopus delemar]KAG1507648.1 hypothetical protein G6F53_008789 [Rhizopus delemar]|eukprot:EIE81327.1 hypothetical protein RO3G_06032 [Rhizopus delemar RA 99-880]
MTSFQNLYVARLITNERPCFVCSKFTNVVLTLADNSNKDWFSICKVHLGDFNFCTKLGGVKEPKVVKKEHKGQPESDSVSDLVSTIGSAWKSWRSKGTTEEEKTEKKEEKTEEKKEEKEEEKEEEKKEKKEEGMVKESSPVQQQQPVRFILQKDYFYLRQREYSKKLKKKEANEKMKVLQFPEVPKDLPSLKK